MFEVCGVLEGQSHWLESGLFQVIPWAGHASVVLAVLAASMGACSEKVGGNAARAAAAQNLHASVVVQGRV